MVKESWMTDCLDNEKLIERDCDYLVEKVKYKDVVYDTVIPWAQAMAKGEMPYLHGVYVCLFIEDYKFRKFFFVELITVAMVDILARRASYNRALPKPKKIE